MAKKPLIPKGPFGNYRSPSDSTEDGWVGDRSRGTQIGKFEAGEEAMAQSDYEAALAAFNAALSADINDDAATAKYRKRHDECEEEMKKIMTELQVYNVARRALLIVRPDLMEFAAS